MRIRTRGAAGCWLLLPLAPLAWIAWTALHADPSFDGAMNLLVARSVAAGTGYGFRYDTFFPFPAQTDGPFVLPAALLFRVFGVGPVTAQATGLGYLLGVALVLSGLLRSTGASIRTASLATALCLALPGTDEYAANGYGEFPMLFWVLAGLLVLARTANRPRAAAALFAGLLLGLALLTKLVALLCVAPVVLAAAAIVFAPERSGNRLRLLAAFGGGLLLPVVGWELFRFHALGGSAAWREWWRLQLGQAALQSGGNALGLAPGALLEALRAHLAVLSGQLGLPRAALAFWLAVPWLWTLVRLRSAPPHRRLVLSALALGAAAYAGWWLLVTPMTMAWLRRILPGLVLQTALLVLLVSEARRRPGRLLGAALLLAQLAVLFTGVASLARLDPTPERRAMAQAVAAVRALPPDAVLFGVGWWQAPVLSLFSGRTVMNIDRWTPGRVLALREAVFVADAPARSLGADAVRRVTTVATLFPLLDNRAARLSRIEAIDPGRPARIPPAPRSGFDAAHDLQAQGIGWYPSAGGWAWVRPRSRLLLAHDRETRLVIEAAFWSELFVPGGAPPHLRVSAAGCLDRVVPVPGAGLRRIVLPLACPASPGTTTLEVALALDATMPVPHQLDADTRVRSFEIRRIALEE